MHSGTKHFNPKVQESEAILNGSAPDIIPVQPRDGGISSSPPAAQPRRTANSKPPPRDVSRMRQKVEPLSSTTSDQTSNQAMSKPPSWRRESSFIIQHDLRANQTSKCELNQTVYQIHPLMVTYLRPHTACTFYTLLLWIRWCYRPESSARSKRVQEHHSATTNTPIT